MSSIMKRVLITIRGRTTMRRMSSLRRLSSALLPLFFLTQCFQVTHAIDWRDDGALDVRWIFRFSKALDQAQQEQKEGEKKGDKKEESLSDMVDKQQKEIPANLKGLVKDLKVRKIESEFDAGMEVSFLVPNYEKFPYGKMKKEEFPIVPQFLPSKKQLVFHFEPVKKDGQAKDKGKKSESSQKGKQDKDGGSDTSGTAESEEAGKQMDDMTKKLTQMFLSSVRYQIILGKRLAADKVVIKKGELERKGDILSIGDMTMIDLPLFALFGEKEEPFDLIIQLK